MIRTELLVFIVLLSVSASVSVSAASVISFQDGDGNGYSGTSDTWIQSTAPSSANGAFDRFSVVGTGFRESHGLIRFDDLFGSDSGQISAGTNIVKATLELQRSSVLSGNDGFRIHEMLVAWEEDNATWDSMTNGVQADDTEAKAAPVSTFSSTEFERLIAVDVTSSLQSWQSGSENHGWVIQNSDNVNLSLLSSEIGTVSVRPRLLVEVTAIPEPSSVLACLMASGMIFGLRRPRRLQGH